MLAVNQENEKLMEEYEKLASEVRLGLRGPPPLPYLCSPNPAEPWTGPAEPTSPQSSRGLSQPPPAISTHPRPPSAHPGSCHPLIIHPVTRSFLHSLIFRQSPGPLCFADLHWSLDSEVNRPAPALTSGDPHSA